MTNWGHLPIIYWRQYLNFSQGFPVKYSSLKEYTLLKQSQNKDEQTLLADVTYLLKEKFDVVSKVLFYWSVWGHKQQRESIRQYCAVKNINDSFPYESSTIIHWTRDWIRPDSQQDSPWDYWKQGFLIEIIKNGCLIEAPGEVPDLEQNEYIWCMLPESFVEAAETYKNFYTYDVQSVYDVNKIVIAWSVISGILFAGSIIVYKKTDFK